MSQDKNSILAAKIIELVGGAENITQAVNCMTRVRLSLADYSLPNKAELKALEGVLGIVEQGSQFQVIVGPGKAGRVTEALNAQLGAGGAKKSAQLQGNDIAIEQRKALKAQQAQSPFNAFVKKFANIFLPIIPAFIGCGLLQGILSIIKDFDPAFAHTQIGLILALLGQGLYLFGLNLFVGVNTAKEFGGTPILGGMLATVISSPALATITMHGAPLTPGRGGVIAVVILVILMSWVEKKLRKITPESLELFIIPLVVVFVGGLASIYVIQPIGGAVADGIAVFFMYLINHGGAVAGFIMGGLFLPLVMFGVHQGLIPIHVELMQKLGSNPLFPILAMAGGGQVGSAIAVYIKTDKVKLKRVIKAAAPVGVLGIGEPLIYGVTLPLRRSFVAACLGGAFGGAVVAGLHVATYGFAISGLLGMLIATKPIEYLIGLIVAYVFGFIFTMILGFDDSIYADDNEEASVI